MQHFFTNVWAIFWMLLFFGGSIFVHELGHFLIAKKRGLFVPRFSIGFGPKIFSWKKGETEYCVSLLPLGGYVALPQLGETPILEGNEHRTDKALSFTDKFLVAVMGAMFNLLFAAIIATILWIVGLSIPEQEKTTTIGYILPHWEEQGQPKQITPAVQAGLRVGDTILSVDGHRVEKFSDIEKCIILGTNRDQAGRAFSQITFERQGQIQSVTLYPLLIKTNPLTKDFIRFSGIVNPKQELTIEALEDGSAAKQIGLKPGDTILAIDQENLYSFMGLRSYLEEKKPESVVLTVRRGSDTLQLPCKLQKVMQQKPWLSLNSDKQYLEFYPENAATLQPIKILQSSGALFDPFVDDSVILYCNGIAIKTLEQLHAVISQNMGKTLVFEVQNEGAQQLISLPLDSVVVNLHEPEYVYRLGVLFQQKMLLTHPTPWKLFSQSLESTVETFRCLFNKNSDVKVQHLMGAPGIMRLLHRFSTDDFRRLLWFIVLLNINLAVLNLLPLPVLDGGHILFAILEKIRGKALPFSWLNAIQSVFVVLFLSLMLYVTFFDIRRWQGDIKMESEHLRLEKLAVPIRTVVSE